MEQGKTTRIIPTTCHLPDFTYQPIMAIRDAPIYPRYGYRRIQVFMGRRGHAMSTDRVHRLWRLQLLQVPVKKPRRRVSSARPRPLPATALGHVGAYDFVVDRCANGSHSMRILCA